VVECRWPAGYDHRKHPIIAVLIIIQVWGAAQLGHLLDEKELYEQSN
jgi:hypothetical protein